MVNSSTTSPKVFISYSHDSDEHKDRVVELAHRLRKNRIDCIIDIYYPFPAEGWSRWIQNQLDWADFVLIICTETYNRRFRGQEVPNEGRGVTFEGAIITQKLYNKHGQNLKFIPIVFSSEDKEHIPSIIQSYSHYELDAEYENLYRYLTDQPLTPKPDLGEFKKLEPRATINSEENPFNELEADTALTIWRKEKYYGEFVGRDNEQQEILNHLETGKDNQILSISGIGGFGKTALCHRIVARAYKAKLFGKIVWIRARVYEYQTNSLGKREKFREESLTFEDAIKDIGRELKIQNNILQNLEQSKSKISEILNSERCLIVIDGLEDSDSPKLLTQELRNILGKSYLILTSRESTDVDSRNWKLTKLDEECSRRFIHVIAREKFPDKDNPFLQDKIPMKSILQATDGLPLAMKLLVSQVGILNIDKSIQHLQCVSDEEELYDYLFEDSWEELQRGETNHAQQLLIMLAGRPRRQRSIDKLYGWYKLSELEVERALEKLVKLSLVEISSGARGKKQVSIHSFTARYFWEKLREKYV